MKLTTCYNSAVGAVLRSLRKQSDLNISNVSLHTKFAPATISKLENGDNNITISHLERLAKYYKVSVSLIFQKADSLLFNAMNSNHIMVIDSEVFLKYPSSFIIDGNKCLKLNVQQLLDLGE